MALPEQLLNASQHAMQSLFASIKFFFRLLHLVNDMHFIVTELVHERT